MRSQVDIAKDHPGVSEADAKSRLDTYGPNIDRKKSEGDDLRGIIASPRLWLTAAAVLLYAFIIKGYAQTVVLLILLLGYLLWEIRKHLYISEQHKRLEELFPARYTVIRGGQARLVQSRFLVQGDLILLEEGDAVPADARLMECDGLIVNERALGGETRVLKKPGGSGAVHELKEGYLYKGSHIIAGEAAAEVTAIGVDTRIFGMKIKRRQETAIKKSESQTQHFIENWFGRRSILFVVGIGAALLYMLFSFVLWDGREVADLLISYLPAALALCFVAPEADERHTLARSVGVFLSYKAIVKDFETIKRLADVASFAAEKNADITEERFSAQELYTADENIMANIAVLSCDMQGRTANEISPFDLAIMVYAQEHDVDVKRLRGHERVRAYPYNEKKGVGGNLWAMGGDAKLMCVKGMPENIFALCRFAGDELYAAQDKYAEMAGKGMRVVAVAYHRLAADEKAPDNPLAVRYAFAGLMSFSDSVKINVPKAVSWLRQAGVNTVLMAGENKDTCTALAKQIGMRNIDSATGDELFKAEQSGGILAFKHVNVCAMLSKSQRPTVINMLRNAGQNPAIIVRDNDDLTLDIAAVADVVAVGEAEAQGALREQADIILPSGDMMTFGYTLRIARRTIRKNVLAVKLAVSCTAGMIAAGLSMMLCGFGGAVTPVLMSLIGIIFAPAAMMIYTIEGQSVPQRISSRGSGNDAQNAKTALFCLLRGVITGLLPLLSVFFVQGNGQIAAMIFSMMICGLLAQSYTQGYGFISPRRLIREARKGFLALAVSVVVMVLMVYTPFLNAALGFEAPFVVTFAAGCVAAAAAQMLLHAVTNRR
jgi:Ca2+-transporting ATPase